MEATNTFLSATSRKLLLQFFKAELQSNVSTEVLKVEARATPSSAEDVTVLTWKTTAQPRRYGCAYNNFCITNASMIPVYTVTLSLQFLQCLVFRTPYPRKALRACLVHHDVGNAQAVREKALFSRFDNCLSISAPLVPAFELRPVVASTSRFPDVLQGTLIRKLIRSQVVMTNGTLRKAICHAWNAKDLQRILDSPFQVNSTAL
ncbi:hypothetical protein BV22DRAFT_382044 [Leucogyrophana mollusca]|uniref:Uncharacterized protein n=1 Tax=Leucogyrophana mollusca TaxID=85980 RepID=A0ACB8BLU5_9AGAM|nr:hypothetical protein BV22DRAFT_382044 [Leucogyrophana mollusca]